MHYVLSQLTGDSCSDWLLGDINNDTTLNILDVVTLVNFVLNTVQPEECQSETSDLNQDGGLNILDIVQLVNIILNN
ncbi:dockerin type I domain-containing protein [bacterium]|nr:dockerin type I domain-containing protein [bacterium]